MAKQGAKSAKPTLRFPEFRGTAEWRISRMDSLYRFIRNNVLSRDKLNYERGPAKNIHYGDIHTKFPVLFDITKERAPFINDTEEVPVAGSEDYCIEGDVIFADASEDTDDVGKSMEIVRLSGERLLSGQHTILARRKDESLIVGFGGYLFRTGLIRSQIEKEAQGTKVYQISSSRLAGISITYPGETVEQKKIADCLASLDEVIAAQCRKVEALKAHKFGLMQQLFPRDGEIQPRLRFPEFRKSGAWKLKKIGDMLVETQRPIELLDDADYRLITVKRRYGGLVTRGIMKGREILVKSQFEVRTGDFLISKRQVVHNACGLVTKELDKSIVSNEYSILTPKPGCSIEFFSWFAMQPVVSASFMSCSVGIVIEKMLFKLPDWLKREFLFPSPPEQQRIASFLSNVDSLIAAEAQELEALKIHKRGLMQQLFPTQEAIGA